MIYPRVTTEGGRVYFYALLYRHHLIDLTKLIYCTVMPLVSFAERVGLPSAGLGHLVVTVSS